MNEKVSKELMEKFLAAKSIADRLGLISGFDESELRKLFFVLGLRAQKEAVKMAPEVIKFARIVRQFLDENPNLIEAIVGAQDKGAIH